MYFAFRMCGTPKCRQKLRHQQHHRQESSVNFEDPRTHEALPDTLCDMQCAVVRLPWTGVSLYCGQTAADILGTVSYCPGWA